MRFSPKKREDPSWLVHGVVQAVSVVEKGLDEFSACSYWPPEDPDEVYECRSECHHRRTCEALYAFQKVLEQGKETCGE